MCFGYYQMVIKRTCKIIPTNPTFYSNVSVLIPYQDVQAPSNLGFPRRSPKTEARKTATTPTAFLKKVFKGFHIRMPLRCQAMAKDTHIGHQALQEPESLGQCQVTLELISSCVARSLHGSPQISPCPSCLTLGLCYTSSVTEVCKS